VDCEMANTVENFYQYQIVVYPNPTTGKIYVTNSHQALLSITVLSAEGKVIDFIQDHHLMIDLDLTTVQNGVYLLSIESEGSKQMKRIIKN
jgi:glycyl-tRNA synthetase alpha subunit